MRSDEREEPRRVNKLLSIRAMPIRGPKAWHSVGGWMGRPPCPVMALSIGWGFRRSVRTHGARDPNGQGGAPAPGKPGKAFRSGGQLQTVFPGPFYSASVLVRSAYRCIAVLIRCLFVGWRSRDFLEREARRRGTRSANLSFCECPVARTVATPLFGRGDKVGIGPVFWSFVNNLTQEDRKWNKQGGTGQPRW
ncbi:hypothetical protein LX36DRAFT_104435 [Colletotrichum falcatum]|nr:hypothetical protein LX36DRAFT_104435 [Colletotrichum falcatum]